MLKGDAGSITRDPAHVRVRVRAGAGARAGEETEGETGRVTDARRESRVRGWGERQTGRHACTHASTHARGQADRQKCR